MSYWAAMYRFLWYYTQLERMRLRLVELGAGLTFVVASESHEGENPQC